MIAVLCAVLLLLIVLTVLFAAITLKITYHDGNADAVLTVFGSLIKIRLNEFLQKRLEQNKKGGHGEDEKKENEEKDEDKRKNLLGGINNAFEIIARAKRTLEKSRRFVRRRLCIKRLAVHIDYSMADAALTGITAGTLWALLYQLFALLTIIAAADSHDFAVNPVYDEHFFFKADAECIIKFRIANIIGILLCLLHNYKKSRKE